MTLSDQIAAQFQAGAPGDLHAEWQQKGFEAFQKLGLPGTRHEEWKYTPIKNALNTTLTLNGGSDAPENFQIIPGTEQMPRLVFSNGFFEAELSYLPAADGIIFGTMKNAFQNYPEITEKYFGKIADLKHEHFAALNTAFARDGAFIYLEKNTDTNNPFFIYYVNSGEECFTQTRNLIVAEKGSRAQVVEVFLQGNSPTQYNHLTEFYGEDNSHVHLTEIQTEIGRSTGVHALEASVGRDAHFTCTTFSFSGRMIRNNVNVRMNGAHSEANLNGLYFGTDENVTDNHILIDHRVAHCNSNQLYKGILDDAATGVFNGKIFVQQDAQKTNAFQSSKAILRSENAAINSKPQLEIFADDVKCSHGAAIGQLDKNEIFYLRARGLSKNEAQAILTYAFANEMTAKTPVPAVQKYMDARLRQCLGLTEEPISL